MAHTKAQKAVKGNRDSQSKRLGIKVYGGQKVRPGNVIIRQRGSQFNAGPGTLLSRDFTIIALKEGVVKFDNKRGEKYVSVS
ncbi:50S ribosomal protein L27 [Candidatus Roizmanbacteria bacterium RIFCSPHIGHO2_01_FULL_39_8]|uniref:Large ribosomal subunit protein bL27 n=2 Tax=Candidatus Roizmaniibacteriota TaxID=1752723 RepID=A0A1F7GLV3_9BACT|nr:MAG: 50S ribosomal protein L27 [Candidatus Roizmanbacteria bacterium RIFCSPHIGHO2_01_FULL_39_8]OGK27910.1 MAG: 50S ribosomal protein L27 [Candidatus Roizmanbacteria bacterium RIFCSPHIGHO2_02_FULL_39_9]